MADLAAAVGAAEVAWRSWEKAPGDRQRCVEMIRALGALGSRYGVAHHDMHELVAAQLRRQVNDLEASGGADGQRSVREAVEAAVRTLVHAAGGEIGDTGEVSLANP